MFGVRGAALRALGLRNVARVGWYRLLLRAGMHPVQRLRPTLIPAGDFFDAALPGRQASSTTVAKLAYFGWYPMSPDQPPDWHRNCSTGARVADPALSWWQLDDFNASVGDIKTIWEASRFDWVLHFAVRAMGGDASARTVLNEWLRDWTTHNPAYAGPNWKCGQEASIRVMHLATASLLMQPDVPPSAPLVALLLQHLERIAPTVAYAIGQDNNHGTSEAAALMIGGSWLERAGVAAGAAWHRTGRALLAERAARLVAGDGSFSQHSVNYHRLMLDTLTLAEVWRRRYDLEPFASTVLDRASRATQWLFAMTDDATGDAPNLGANDGANLHPLTASAYRDYRPSVHLAAAVWLQREAYPAPGPWHSVLSMLAVHPASVGMPPHASQLFDDGGYAILRRARHHAVAVLRYPRYRFRPSHADALHVDLWVQHRNLLRDAGSYSYAADVRWQDYFTGVASHNTIQFDDREPMPRLGRFLWGAWLKTSMIKPLFDGADIATAAAAYRDSQGAAHERQLSLGDESLTVVDRVHGFEQRAVVRWRLAPSAWALSDATLRDGQHTLQVSADVPLVRVELVQGWESREYFRKTELPVLEVEVARPGTITTVYSWAQ